MSIKEAIQAKKQQSTNIQDQLVDCLYKQLKLAIENSQNQSSVRYVYLREPCSSETKKQWQTAAEKLLEILKKEEDVIAKLGDSTDGYRDSFHIEVSL